ncbi:uncharacterized protein [Miscanthus floridulus]|uniref:uncharacterized protein n=1 Tax=Miscanthus floridulus TaxID=154761 RepID=UPI0034589FEE
MEAYYQEVRRLEDRFDGLELNHIPRRLNEAADALAKVASAREPVPIGVFASDQHKPSVRYEGSERANNGSPDPAPGADPPTALPDPEVMELEEDPVAESYPPNDWRTLYLDYLLRDALPADKTEARWPARCAKSVILVEGKLYKWSHTGILQLCIPSEQGKLLLSDILGGVCGHHAMPRTLVGNAFRQGFYWPTAVADAEQIVDLLSIMGMGDSEGLGDPKAKGALHKLAHVRRDTSSTDHEGTSPLLLRHPQVIIDRQDSGRQAIILITFDLKKPPCLGEIGA